jgi:hypothetical protein
VTIVEAKKNDIEWGVTTALPLSSFPELPV